MAIPVLILKLQNRYYGITVYWCRALLEGRINVNIAKQNSSNAKILAICSFKQEIGLKILDCIRVPTFFQIPNSSFSQGFWS